MSALIEQGDRAMKYRWTTTLERDEFSKDFYIVLPDKLLEKMEWEVGDALTLDIIKMGIDKSLHITKKDVAEDKK